MLPVFGLIGSLLTGGLKILTDKMESNARIREAVTENKIRLAQSAESHNQSWEMKQLDNSGWKDDILFYAFIAMFVWAGFDPDGASRFFMNLNALPDWFLKTWFWLIASILGVKKIGDYVPSLMNSIKEIVKK